MKTLLNHRFIIPLKLLFLIRLKIIVDKSRIMLFIHSLSWFAIK